MEFYIEKLTNEEMEILESQGFDWYPYSMDSDVVIIEGTEEDYERALHAIGRF